MAATNGLITKRPLWSEASEARRDRLNAVQTDVDLLSTSVNKNYLYEKNRSFIGSILGILSVFVVTVIVIMTWQILGATRKGNRYPWSIEINKESLNGRILC